MADLVGNNEFSGVLYTIASVRRMSSPGLVVCAPYVCAFTKGFNCGFAFAWRVPSSIFVLVVLGIAMFVIFTITLHAITSYLHHVRWFGAKSSILVYILYSS